MGMPGSPLNNWIENLLDFRGTVLGYQLNSLKHMVRAMKNVRFGLDLKPHRCVHSNNETDNDLETLVDFAIFS